MSAALSARLAHERYPRASAYDPQLVLSSYMGPNVLWGLEEVSQHLDLRPGMRVLDLGCGTALSSIFLAREFGVQVVAVDRLVSATENAKRIDDAGLDGEVLPLRLDARTLPFANGYFDAVVSIGAYQYFGTDDIFLRMLARYLRPESQMGIVVTGLRDELDEPPADMAPIWRIGFDTMHDPGWWRRHLLRTQLVDVDVAEFVDESGTDWARWVEVLLDEGEANPNLVTKEVEMLRQDDNRRFGLIKVACRLRT